VGISQISPPGTARLEGFLIQLGKNNLRGYNYSVTPDFDRVIGNLKIHMDGYRVYQESGLLPSSDSGAL
jgi:hypothetical protein